MLALSVQYERIELGNNFLRTIRVRRFFNNNIGPDTLQILFTIVMATVDERGLMVKLCKHASNEHLDIVYSFKMVTLALVSQWCVR